MAYLVCDKCRTVLPGAVVNHGGDMVGCPGCFSNLSAAVFPAFFQAQAIGAQPENVLSDEDAGCFYHPAKKAVIPCGRCGRFLCALCDVDLGSNRHVCPHCLDAARRDPAARQGIAVTALPTQRRVLHDQVALLLVLLPAVLFVTGLWVVSIVTAPLALFLVFRYWDEPGQSLLPRTRFRLILAGVLAVLEVAGWIYWVVRFFR